MPGHYLDTVENDHSFAAKARNCYEVLQSVCCFGPGPRQDSQVIISVPNVANNFVHLALLFGQFGYADRGIMDRTHLRFFTLKSLRRLVGDCAFRIVGLFPTPVPVQIVLPFTNRKSLAIFHELHFLMVSGWKSLLAFQFVIRAQH